MQRVETAHRQSRNRPALLRFVHTVSTLDKLHNVSERAFHSAIHRFRQVEYRLVDTSGSLARSGLLRNISIGHHNNHRLRFPRSNQIIEYLRRASQRNPCLLVATHAMQKIKHRVNAITILVARRSIDSHAPVHIQALAIVPYPRDRAVRNIINTV